MSNTLALAYSFGVVTLLALLGLFCELLTGVVRRWWRRRRRAPIVTLKSKADRNPMTAGCEMDAPTLGLPVEAETGRGRFQ